MPLAFTFRLVTEADLELLHGWLNEPGVVRWWEGDDVSPEGVARDYGPNREDQSTEHWIAEIDGDPVGWICCWPVLDGLEESAAWFPLGVEETAAGIDYLVAAPDRRGQGVGSQMIAAFTDDVVFGNHPEWTQAAASPYSANVASCRALEKAGFAFHGFVEYEDDRSDDGPCSLMVCSRSDSVG